MSRHIITIILIATCFPGDASHFQQLVKQLHSPSNRTATSSSFVTQTDNFTAPLIFNCTDPLIQCNGHGYCNTNNTECHCMDQYTTLVSPNGTQCNYKRYRQVDLFCFQFFLGKVGVADWIIGQYKIATGKLTLTLVWLFFPNILSLLYGKNSDGLDDFLQRIKIWRQTILFAIIVWWLISVIYYGMNKYIDQNGISPLNAPGLGNQGFVR